MSDPEEERTMCYECGARITRYAGPMLCHSCLNGPVAAPPEPQAKQCVACRAWSTQTIERKDLWDSTRTRTWCQPCVEQASREALVYAQALRVPGLR